MTALALAAASYHGIPAEIIARSDIHTGDDGILYFTVQIPIRDEDLGPIVKRMRELQESQAQAEAAFVPDQLTPLQLDQLREDYIALSPAERGKYGSFARYKASRMMDDVLAAHVDIAANIEKAGQTLGEIVASEGIGGRKVQHIDAPEQEAESELPAAVWVAGADLAKGQLEFISDRKWDGAKNHYLIHVSMLTPEQRAKYAPEVKS